MPDFGSFRGFGEKLAQGQTPTQLGKIGSESAYDGDANAFFLRVTTAGGTLSDTEKVAVNQLVLDMKSAGIWTPMKAVYPMVGASAAACKQNLISSSFTGTFSTGWTFASTGVTPNGTSAYFDTTLIPSVSLSLNSTHLALYSRTNSAISGFDYNAGSTLEIITKWVDTIFFYAVNSIEISAGTQSSSAGFFSVSRTASNSQKAYYNGTIKNTSTNSSTSLPSVSLIYGALNSVPKDYWSNRQTAFLSAGDGLTDTQVSDFYTTVQAFQTTLGRQV